MPLNLREYRFTKAEVLALIPTLSPKIFMNWCESGLIDLRVKGKTRLLSPLGVIKLAGMHEAVQFGLRPPAAAEVVDQATPRIVELWGRLPQFPEGSERQSFVLPTNSLAFYAVFEVDFLFGTVVVRMIRLVNGEPLDDPAPAHKPKSTKSAKGHRK
jgi:hypothetical protein